MVTYAELVLEIRTNYNTSVTKLPSQVNKRKNEHGKGNLWLEHDVQKPTYKPATTGTTQKDFIITTWTMDLYASNLTDADAAEAELRRVINAKTISGAAGWWYVDRVEPQPEESHNNLLYRFFCTEEKLET